MFPNSDPVMFMVAFYGCLLAELVPVPVEVPLTRKVAKGAGSPVLLGGFTSVLVSSSSQGAFRQEGVCFGQKRNVGRPGIQRY